MTYDHSVSQSICRTDTEEMARRDFKTFAKSGTHWSTCHCLSWENSSRSRKQTRLFVEDILLVNSDIRPTVPSFLINILSLTHKKATRVLMPPLLSLKITAERSPQQWLYPLLLSPSRTTTASDRRRMLSRRLQRYANFSSRSVGIVTG